MLSFFTGLTFANGVSLDRNRIVFNEKDESKTINIVNNTNGIYLVKTGISSTSDGKGDSPFTTLPPLSRLGENSNNAIRIIRKESNLPKDRESLFYFYATIIPSSSISDNEVDSENIKSRLSIGMRIIIKCFFRPQGLSISVQESYDKVFFKKLGNKIVLMNTSPYYLTLSSLKFGNTQVKIDSYNNMVSPFSQIQFSDDVYENGEIHVRFRNDFGGETDIVSYNLSSVR